MSFGMLPADVVPLIAFAMVLATAIVNIFLAIGVWMDANDLRKEGRRVYLLPPPFWGLTTLLMGLVAAAVYWGINRSTFRRD